MPTFILSEMCPHSDISAALDVDFKVVAFN